MSPLRAETQLSLTPGPGAVPAVPVRVQGSHQWGGGSCLSRHRCLDATKPRRRRKPRSSGMVAAAGVVNQADEQRILLPGYFTTPGLHHTHPLQGAAWDQDSDWGRGAVGSLCERVSFGRAGS